MTNECKKLTLKIIEIEKQIDLLWDAIYQLQEEKNGGGFNF
jgi:hypothetical protein